MAKPLDVFYFYETHGISLESCFFVAKEKGLEVDLYKIIVGMLKSGWNIRRGRDNVCDVIKDTYDKDKADEMIDLFDRALHYMLGKELGQNQCQ